MLCPFINDTSPQEKRQSIQEDESADPTIILDGYRRSDRCTIAGNVQNINPVHFCTGFIFYTFPLLQQAYMANLSYFVAKL